MLDLFDARILAFCAVVGVLTITPGADTMLVIRNTMRSGRRAGWLTTLGVNSGVLLHAVLSALGVSAILATSAVAFQVVKIAGALYLIWLGIKELYSTNQTEAKVQELKNSGADPAPRPLVGRQAADRAYLEGFLTNILNPKVAIFYLAFLPQFISPGDPVLLKSVILALIHNVMGMAWLSVVALAVSRGRRFLAQGRARTILARISGAVLIGLGLRLALTDR